MTSQAMALMNFVFVSVKSSLFWKMMEMVGFEPNVKARRGISLNLTPREFESLIEEEITETRSRTAMPEMQPPMVAETAVLLITPIEP